MSTLQTTGRQDVHSGDRIEAFAYASLLFPICLLTALIGRFLTLPLALFGRSQRRRLSILAEASEMTRSIIPWIFMGR